MGEKVLKRTINITSFLIEYIEMASVEGKWQLNIRVALLDENDNKVGSQFFSTNQDLGSLITPTQDLNEILRHLLGEVDWIIEQGLEEAEIKIGL